MGEDAGGLQDYRNACVVFVDMLENNQKRIESFFTGEGIMIVRIFIYHNHVSVYLSQHLGMFLTNNSVSTNTERCISHLQKHSWF